MLFHLCINFLVYSKVFVLTAGANTGLLCPQGKVPCGTRVIDVRFLLSVCESVEVSKRPIEFPPAITKTVGEIRSLTKCIS